MKIIYKDVLDGLKEIKDRTIRCCITSPPYYQCRNYGNKDQIGLEESEYEYLKSLFDVFKVVGNKLTPDGNLFVNLGDKYNKNKNLMLLPSRFAILMQEDGWILRNKIIWHKPNFQPSPVKDRLTNAYEEIFHFVKSKKYYYDLDSIRIKSKCDNENSKNVYDRFVGKIKKSDLLATEKTKAIQQLDTLYKNGQINNDARIKLRGKAKILFGSDSSLSGRAKEIQNNGFYFHCNNAKGKNMGDVLSVNVKSHKSVHEAVFPENLIIPLIKVGSAKGDTILDCFAGTGTTLKASKMLGRNSIGIELNEDYKTK